MREETLRKALLVGAAICWATSLTLSWLIIDRVINTLHHPGVSLIVFTAQGLAITLTIVWAQFRNRRVVTEALRAGVVAAREASRSD